MTALPPRYEPLERLGSGGGGEVWAVRCRHTGKQLALKLLAPHAGEAEVLALVREAVALSGLEGLGLPRVVAFGTLPESGRRYLVRELVVGRSLEEVLADDEPDSGWAKAFVRACEVLTVIHRAGLLHGDIKPANVILGPAGEGTFVDLGLAAEFREGGAKAEGLTPKFAAPELLMGEPLTVRSEVYSLGATLAEALARKGDGLDDEVRLELAKVAARATQPMPAARYPSVDELASSLRRVLGIEAHPFGQEAAWPVLGLDAPAARLCDRVRELPDGGVLAFDAPPGAGRTTLLRRLAWTLGASGVPVCFLEGAAGAPPSRESIELEMASWGRDGAGPPPRFVMLVDDAESLAGGALLPLQRLRAEGARLVLAAPEARARGWFPTPVEGAQMAPLDGAALAELLRRTMPSLTEALAQNLIARASGRPGALRDLVRRLAGHAVISPEDVDRVLVGGRRRGAGVAASGGDVLQEVEALVLRGRFAEASALLEGLSPEGDDARARADLSRARVALGRNDVETALRILLAMEPLAAKVGCRRAWAAVRARAALRSGAYAEAVSFAEEATRGPEDALTADAFAVAGVARAYGGDEAAALADLERSLLVARGAGDVRAEGIASGSLAIVHQRAGRTDEARRAYEDSLRLAEAAHDTSTMAAARANLAILVQSAGDLALALQHLEAAVDLGQRAGTLFLVDLALLNLANLDLYLGRYARARASLDSLEGTKERLPGHARAQLLGLQAELAARTGELDRAQALYGACAEAFEALGRPLDGAEARLEALLVAAKMPSADARTLMAEHGALEARIGGSGLGEHRALSALVRGTLALRLGDDALARRAFDEALLLAREAGRKEWAWRALDERARLLGAKGSTLAARKDAEAALAILEETAAKLPRDLREVFWDDARRKALLQRHSYTTPSAPVSPARSSGVADAGQGTLGPASLGAAITGTATLTSGSSLGAASLGTASLGTASFGTTMSFPRLQEDRLARLLELTRELAREHDLGRLLTLVTDHAVGLLGAERGRVLLVDDDGKLVVHTARAKAEDDEHVRFSRSVAERAVSTGEPVVAVRAPEDSRLAAAASVHQLHIQSVACVPIRGTPPALRPIGALYVETRLRPGSRFQEELPTLLAFADQAAIAIESARLLAENQRRAEELERANAELAVAKDKLAAALERRTEQLQATRRDLRKVREELRGRFGYAGMVGTSAAMRKVYALIDRVRATDVPVLIVGESGTGKEVAARAIHEGSDRAKGPFLGINCGAIPENLLESELFGHVRGAFTGADRERKGILREASGGTLLLDEIGELPAKMQAGLLRVLQEKAVRPVGASHEEPVDVRILAATHRDLEAMVAAGTFREDLYYRLHVVALKLPPLRERVEDIPPLIDHLLSVFAARYKRDRKSVSRDALRRLSAYGWPGNVRQLEHVLLNAWLMGESDEITAEDISLPDTMPRVAVAPSAPTLQPVTAVRPVRAQNHAEHKASERERILSALEACNWNRLKAAEMIGVPRRTFYRRLKEFGILE